LEIVGSISQIMESKMIELSWLDIAQLLKKAPPGKLWGVPRGGAIVAGLTGRAVDRVEDADFIVDDIIDSGATKIRYQSFNKPFWGLVNPGDYKEWVKFPWETSDPTADLEDTVKRQLQWIGEDCNRDGLLETPKRVLKALKEMTVGYALSPKEILNKTFDVQHDELVMLRNIRFASLCEHHLLPFTGKATVGYLPGAKIVGLSKLARLVHCHSKRLQVQERLTQAIAKDIETHLKPRGTAVVIKAIHHCMVCRGLEMDGADMVTSAMYGDFRTNQPLRAEFLTLMNTV